VVKAGSHHREWKRIGKELRGAQCDALWIDVEDALAHAEKAEI
jgi:hypothetical protein